jgi:transcriptional regulator with XRE-family HTH domain
MKKMTNREKFLTLVSPADPQTEIKNNWRIANRRWLKASQQIALDILERLDELGWTQRDLAEKMGVSPQYFHKIVKGSENLTLDTQTKLQEILEIPILASYFKAKNKNFPFFILNFEGKIENYFAMPILESSPLEDKNTPIKTNIFLTPYFYSEIV